MQRIPESVQALIDAGQPFQVTASTVEPGLPGYAMRNTIKAEYSAAVSGDSMLIGSACAATLDLHIAKPQYSVSNLVGATAQAYWRVPVRDSSQTQYTNYLLRGKILELEDEGSTLKVHIADAIAADGNKIYSPAQSVLQDCAIYYIWADIAEQLGVELDFVYSEGVIYSHIVPGGAGNFPAGITLREAAAQCAAACGGNAIITRYGKLALHRPSAAPIKAVTPYLDDCTVKAQANTVGTLTFRRRKTVNTDIGDGDSIETVEFEDYSAGAGEPQVIIPNLLADAYLAERVYRESVSDVRYYGGEIAFPREMTIEPGDILTVHTADGDYPMMASQITLAVDGGCRSSLESRELDIYDQESGDIRDEVDNAEYLGKAAQEALRKLAERLRASRIERGDSYARDNGIYPAFISSSRKKIHIGIPVGKMHSGTDAITVTELIGGLRIADGGYLSDGAIASGTSDWLHGSNVDNVVGSLCEGLATVTITLREDPTVGSTTATIPNNSTLVYAGSVAFTIEQGG